ncbi:hypothetical protein B0T22DRAFT_296101 [Podospora appendiculata]|uniref:Ecp2 effector protein-like domain-containing protein n=1 Tax=Podospora appendiculata TaxID=314037 RepID=A0AAE0X1U6_9PEZI|nr:hypothetical protein B0T22DRAFT_296101 [Podospora appendiculata]
MPVSLHLLAQLAIAGLAAAAAIASPPVKDTTDLAARDANPSPATVHVSPLITFTRSPEDTHDPATRRALTPRTSKNKKKDFIYTASGQSSYCMDDEGEPITTTSSDPLSADCQAIAYAWPNAGYWTIPAAATAAAPGGVVTLLTSGTCAFKLHLLTGTAPPYDFLFGTNDLRYYIGVYVRQAVGGHIGVKGTASCWNPTPGYFPANYWLARP